MQLPLIDDDGELFWAGLDQVAILRPKSAGLEIVLLSGRVGRFPRTAAEAIAMFAPRRFVQVDRAEIVNTAYIEAVDRERRTVLFVQEETGGGGKRLTATVSAANLDKLRDWLRESAGDYGTGETIRMNLSQYGCLSDVKVTYEVGLKYFSLYKLTY